MSESVNGELNRIKYNIVNTYSTLSDVGLISEGDTNSDNLANTVKNLSWGGGELCDIGLALFIDESAGMRRLLNGQILNIESKYKPFLNKLQLIATAYPNILCTETEWQAIKESSPFGQVGKFVLNYNEAGESIVSVRLPAVVNLQGLQDLQYLGDKLDEALPNITGSFSSLKQLNANFNFSYTEGAFYSKGENGASNSIISSGNSSNAQALGGFDASRCSSAYKDNAHVQQEAIQYPYYIQVNLTEYNHMIDVGQIQELKDRIYIVEQWNEGNNWYRVWSNGFCEQGGLFHKGSGEVANNLITFFKPYLEIPNVIFTRRFNADKSGDSTAIQIRTHSIWNVTLTGFYCYANAWASSSEYWEAKGYIAL